MPDLSKQKVVSKKTICYKNINKPFEKVLTKQGTHSKSHSSKQETLNMKPIRDPQTFLAIMAAILLSKTPNLNLGHTFISLYFVQNPEKYSGIFSIA